MINSRRLALLIVATLITVSCAADPASLSTTITEPAPTTTSDPIEDELSELLDGARRSYGARGALALVRAGGESWPVASGDADVDGAPVDPDMSFRIGSITKTLVAALILDQVGHGDLTLEDDVFELIGPPLDGEPSVTVRMLLDHTSGVFDIGNEGDAVADIASLSDPDLVAEAQQLIASASGGESVVASDRLIVGLAETHDRYFAPGTGFHYSNTNYQLLGMVLETVTGSSLDQVFTDRLVDPLGLGGTYLAPADTSSPDLRGYSTDLVTGEIIDPTDDLLAFGNGGSGGVVSTAAELTSMLTTIVHTGFLTGELRDAMGEATSQSGGSYGLGLATYELRCGTFFGHEGRVNGTASIALVDTRYEHRSVVIAVNRGDGETGLTAMAEELLCSIDSPR